MKNIFRFFILLTGIFILNTSTAQIVDPVKWKLSSKKISECEYEIQFTGTIELHWHVYSLNQSGADGPMPANIFVDKSNDYEAVGKPTEGSPIKAMDKVFEMEVLYFEKTVTFKQKIKVKTDKEVVVKGKYEYQACTEEKCIFPPATPFEFKLKGSAECGKQGVRLVPVEGNGANFIIDSEAVAKAFALKNNSATEIKKVKNDTPDKKVAATATKLTSEVQDTSLDSVWWSIFLTGFLWGFAALFTPCVCLLYTSDAADE